MTNEQTLVPVLAVDDDSSDLAELPIGNDLGFLLAKLHATGSQLTNVTLAEFGLKERSFSVLALACWDRHPTQREMAALLTLDPSQIVALIDELESAQLVERKPGIMDRRQRILLATAKGRRVYSDARAAVGETERAQLGALTPEEAETVKSLLRKVLLHT
ncbi:MarR family winged helix-turn-helix transcriptional regulator [Arthrobacter sp. GMC3]|uniref:MarR family winged helix-turn-helix transcriptional regulator n=1 Tax=Arthrobacter sp. GMC3 TaxID=2058894 RepID=UPI00215717F0|nr:MarR family winged helix-turn-helix transcriptional regulator [Arthrobacter sp. GMC3]